MAAVHTSANVPISHLTEYVKNASQSAPYLVSVGCGNGKYETIIAASLNPNIKLILIDPDPESFEKTIVKSPDYPTTSELIQKRPEVVNNCVLLLIWSDWGSVKYDYDAFESLKPIGVILLCEYPPERLSIETISGASGSDKMISVVLNPGTHNYKLISMTEYRFKNAFGGFYPKLVWLAKKGSQIPKVRTVSLLQAKADEISHFLDSNDPGTCTIS